MKRGVLFLLLCVMILPVVYGEFSITVNPDFQAITVDQQAEFEVTIYNEQPFQDVFYVNNNKDIKWGIIARPLLDYTSGMHIPAHSSLTTTVLIKPPEGIALGRHFFVLDVTSLQTYTVKDKLLEIRIIEPSVYLEPSLKVKLDVPSMIDPRYPQDIGVVLENQNGLNLTNITLFIKSNLLNQIATVDLGPNETSKSTFTLSVDEKTAPQDDTINLIVMYQGEIYYNTIENYEIVSYGELLHKEVKTKRGFLRTTKTIEFTNNANAQVEETYTYDTNFFKRLVVKTDPRAQVQKDDSGSFYAWQLVLLPDQKMEIKIIYNYLWIFIVAVLALIVGILYWMNMEPLLFKKDIIDIKMVEGGLAEIKVRVRVKNKKAMLLEKSSLVDRIPQMFSYVTEREIFKPHGVYSHKTEGTVIEFELGDMEPGDKREFTYVIRSKLTIFGQVVLKPALVKYYFEDKLKKSYSNEVNLEVE